MSEAVTNEDVTPGSANFNRQARAVEGRVFPSSSESSFGMIEGFGLTKRELFAAMAMQAILTGAVTRGCPSNEWFEMDTAVRAADALVTALQRSPE